MLEKIPIRYRLTILSVILLTVCCVGLTAILNLSANQMANTIEASVVTPAIDEKDTNKVPSLELTAAVPSEGTKAARSYFLHQSILYMFLVVALGGGLTYYISAKALKPLHELNRQMKNRTVHNLSEDLKIPESHDEIAELTRTFNEMSAMLADAFAMQKRFSQSAAHELRTPLTVLKTKVDVFKKKAHTIDEYDNLLEVITANTNRLAALVTELLDLTNMDSMEYTEEISLNGTFFSVLEELSGLVHEKNITVSVYGDEYTISGNQNLMHRAFYNLIENALKYNIDGGQVDISLISESNNIKIIIADSGIGIPSEMRQLIFEPFFRVDKSRSRQMGGVGLGLSTVMTIINRHNGKIRALENPSGGTIFEIIL